MAKKATGTGRVIKSFPLGKSKPYRSSGATKKAATKKAAPKKAAKSVSKKGRPLR